MNGDHCHRHPRTPGRNGNAVDTVGEQNFLRHIHSVLLEVRTNADVGGYGESFHHFARIEDSLALAKSIEALGNSLVGSNPAPVRQHWHDLYSRVKRTGAYEALSVVDQALWDLKGKAAGLPVSQLLGGGADLRAYATFPHEQDVDELIDAAVDNAGFTAIKIVGGIGVDRDRERIETLSANLPGFRPSDRREHLL